MTKCLRSRPIDIDAQLTVLTGQDAISFEETLRQENLRFGEEFEPAEHTIIPTPSFTIEGYEGIEDIVNDLNNLEL